MSPVASAFIAIICLTISTVVPIRPHCCIKLRLILHEIDCIILNFEVKMEFLYKLLYRESFKLHIIILDEETIVKLFCMKKRLGSHVKKVYSTKFGDFTW